MKGTLKALTSRPVNMHQRITNVEGGWGDLECKGMVTIEGQKVTCPLWKGQYMHLRDTQNASYFEVFIVVSYYR